MIILVSMRCVAQCNRPFCVWQNSLFRHIGDPMCVSVCLVRYLRAILDTRRYVHSSRHGRLRRDGIVREPGQCPAGNSHARLDGDGRRRVPCDEQVVSTSARRMPACPQSPTDTNRHTQREGERCRTCSHPRRRQPRSRRRAAGGGGGGPRGVGPCARCQHRHTIAELGRQLAGGGSGRGSVSRPDRGQRILAVWPAWHAAQAGRQAGIKQAGSVTPPPAVARRRRPRTPARAAGTPPQSCALPFRKNGGRTWQPLATAIIDTLPLKSGPSSS